MDTIETIRLLRQAHDEIIMLRRRLDEVEPKAHAYETLAIIARLAAPNETVGFSEDIAWKLKTAVEELDADRRKGNADAEG